MTALALVGSLVSGVVSAIGAIQQANAAADAADYEAAVKERNRRAILAQTDTETEDKRRDNRRQIAAIRTAYGASGLALEGSPLDVLEDTMIEQETEVERVRYSGKMKAMGYGEEATLARMRADSARSAGAIGAASAIIGGVSGAAKIGMSGGAGFSLSRAA